MSTYKYLYHTPPDFDDIWLASNGTSLTGLWFKGFNTILENDPNVTEQNLPIFEQTARWLDIYFSGQAPDFTPKYLLGRISPFQKEVYAIMSDIPFGQTMTYQTIALQIAKNRGIAKMSPQAIGGAVGANPICLILPCHRVLGKDGSLVGYSNGIQNKIALLRLEKIIWH